MLSSTVKKSKADIFRKKAKAYPFTKTLVRIDFFVNLQSLENVSIPACKPLTFPNRVEHGLTNHKTSQELIDVVPLVKRAAKKDIIQRKSNKVSLPIFFWEKGFTSSKLFLYLRPNSWQSANESGQNCTQRMSKNRDDRWK